MTTGFAGAPLAKLVFIVSAAGSLVLQAARTKGNGLARLLRPLAFRHPGETVVGLLLQYYFRVFERQLGIAKFGAYLLLALGVGQTSATLLEAFKLKTAAGPFAFIFASLVEYTLSVPPAQHFYLLGWRLTDKVFVYLAALQLLWSSPTQNGPACLAGLLLGAAYWVGPFGLQKLKLPATIARRLQGSSRAPAGGAQHVQPTDRPTGPRSQSPAQPQVPLATAPQLPQVSPQALEQLTAMGFDQGIAAQALQQNNNDVSAALTFLV